MHLKRKKILIERHCQVVSYKQVRSGIKLTSIYSGIDTKQPLYIDKNELILPIKQDFHWDFQKGEVNVRKSFKHYMFDYLDFKFNIWSSFYDDRRASK